MTKTELKEKLDELGIEYDNDALKEELESLLEAASIDKAGKDDEGDVTSKVTTTDDTKVEVTNDNKVDTTSTVPTALVESAAVAHSEVMADFHTCFKQMISGLPFKKEE